MAILLRRGPSADFDADRMSSGEVGVATDIHRAWVTTAPGDAWEIANKEDLDATQDALDAEVTAREELETTIEEEVVPEIEKKADADGTYPDLYAGNLSSTKKQTDSVPYLMRKTGGDLSRIGEREDDTLVGATVRVNQLVRNGDFSDGLTGWGASTGTTQTIEDDALKIQLTQEGGYGAYRAIPVVAGHKILNTLQFKGKSGGTYWTNNVVGIITGTGNWQTVYRMEIPSANARYLDISDKSTSDFQPYYVKNIMTIDLTAMLGSTIADYIYSLESATAGAGIAKLREWGFLTNGYIPYNAGSLESVEATAHKMVGFNCWDEETEVGRYNPSTGVKELYSATIRSANYIPVFPNTSYYVHFPDTITIGNINICYYDADKNFISFASDTYNPKTTPANASYMTFYIDSKYGTTYNHDICINLSNPDRNGEYEPYSAHTYDLGTDTLRGLFKLDSENRLFADGDMKTSDGTVTRKYGVVDLGTLTWAKSIDSVFTTTDLVGQVKEPAVYNVNPNLVCSKYLSASYVDLLPNAKDKTVTVIWSASGSHGQVWVRDSAYSDATAFKTAMDGVYMVYELATPTTEQSTPFQNSQICDPDGTEEYITSNGIPVGHVTEYDYDIKGLAEELIDVPDVPSSNGTYVLKATRSASGISYEWVSETVTQASALSTTPATSTTDTEAGDTV